MCELEQSLGKGKEETGVRSTCCPYRGPHFNPQHPEQLRITADSSFRELILLRAHTYTGKHPQHRERLQKGSAAMSTCCSSRDSELQRPCGVTHGRAEFSYRVSDALFSTGSTYMWQVHTHMCTHTQTHWHSRSWGVNLWKHVSKPSRPHIIISFQLSTAFWLLA